MAKGVSYRDGPDWSGRLKHERSNASGGLPDLCPGISRIRLCVSSNHNKVPIFPTSILETLADDEAFMDLVGRGVVILKPRSYAPLLDDEF